MAKSTTPKKKKIKVDAYGQVHISSSFNNIIISITDRSGTGCGCTDPSNFGNGNCGAVSAIALGTFSPGTAVNRAMKSSWKARIRIDPWSFGPLWQSTI